jgi:GTP-sensing pleiotropic transcriptional regulator CodY
MKVVQLSLTVEQIKEIVTLLRNAVTDVESTKRFQSLANNLESEIIRQSTMRANRSKQINGISIE